METSDKATATFVNHCPLCLHESRSAEVDLPEFMYRTGHSYEYAVCQRCESLYAREGLPQSEELYPPNYYSLVTSPEALFPTVLHRSLARLLSNLMMRQRLRTLRVLKLVIPQKQARTMTTILFALAKASRSQGLQPKSFLDVGTGTGAVPMLLSFSHEITCLGIDPFLDQSDFHAQDFDLRRCDLSDVTGTWDLLLLSHSLEHTEDPSRVLALAHSLTSDKGVVVVRVPTLSSYAYRTFQKSWFQLDAPRHRFIPSRKGLEVLVKRSGFEVLDVIDDSTTAQFWLSEAVASGKALMATEGSTWTMQKAPRWSLRQVQLAWKTGMLNRKSDGDQISVILRPRRS
jgi:hypothetical protein